MKNKNSSNVYGPMAGIIAMVEQARGLAEVAGFDLQVSLVPAGDKPSKNAVAEVDLEAKPEAKPRKVRKIRRKRRVSYPVLLERRKALKDQILALVKEAGKDGITAVKLASRLRVSGQRIGQNLRHLAADPEMGVTLTHNSNGRIVSVAIKSQG
jgi:hypothetical protein